MKIKTDEPSRIITEQMQKASRPKEAAKFNDILQRTIEAAGAQQAQKNAGVQAVSAPQNIQTIGPVGEEQGPVLERVEQLLDTLEEYQHNLGRASITPDELRPFVNRMEEQHKALAAVLVTLPDGDNLKDILNRVLITSVVEVEKFRRGDCS